MSVFNFLRSKLLLSFNRKQIEKLTNYEVKKILILKYDRIGDMIVATPLIRKLNRILPNAEIHVLASTVNAPIIQHNKRVEKIFIFNNNWLKMLPTLFKLRSERFDVIFELEASFVTRAFLISKFINSKYIFSVEKLHGRFGLESREIQSYDYYAKRKPGDHWSEIILRSITPLLNSTNDQRSYPQYEIVFDDLSRKAPIELLTKLPKERLNIGINIKGQSHSGQINKRTLINIFEIIEKNYPNKVNIIFLSSPENSIDYDKFIKSLNFNFIFNSAFNILEVSYFISRLDMVISPDTSIVHIAGAFDVPCMAIYPKNQSNYNFWAPKSSQNSVIFSRSKTNIENFDNLEFVNSLLKMIKNLMKFKENA